MNDYPTEFPAKEVFNLVSEKGLPLDIIRLELRDKNMFFNTLKFLEECNKGGWTMERAYKTVLASMEDAPQQVKDYLMIACMKAYESWGMDYKTILKPII